MVDITQYRIEPAKSNRSICRTSNLFIKKTRYVLVMDLIIGEKTEYLTIEQIANINSNFGGIENVDGYAALSTAQQKTVFFCNRVSLPQYFWICEYDNFKYDRLLMRLCNIIIKI